MGEKDPDKQLMDNQLDSVVEDKVDKKVTADVSGSNDSNIREKEQENVEKHQGMRKELEKKWG